MNNTPHQKFCFYHLPTRGRVGVKLGDADTSPTYMLFYYQSWMFYNHFIVILYHFWVLTYWHSAQCYLMFSACFYIVGNRYQTGSKCNATPRGFFGPEESQWAKEAPEGLLEVSSTHQGAPGGPGTPWGVVPSSSALRTASLLYKYHNIPETLGESMKINSSRCRVQNHQIQSRHRHGGVHHFDWCLSYDVWVVLCRPMVP